MLRLMRVRENTNRFIFSFHMTEKNGDLYGGLAVLTTHLSETVVRDPYIIRYQNDENSRILMLDNLQATVVISYLIHYLR